MERNANYDSVDELIKAQSTQVKDLKQVLSLISDRKYLGDDMKRVSIMIRDLKQNMEVLRKEKKRCDSLLAQIENCHETTSNIQRKISHIENNFPNKFNKIYYPNEMMESVRSFYFIHMRHKYRFNIFSFRR